jgi:hypothetical protein
VANGTRSPGRGEDRWAEPRTGWWIPDWRRAAWEGAGGLLAIAAALALWAIVLAGVAAPLGQTLARLESARREPAPLTCPVPEGALASAGSELTSPASPSPGPCGRTAPGR